ncbi:TPA: hypothetical protein RSZ98_004774 [Escherichia coli]|nr:hypothetical protein [Escherichia coli]
MSNQFNKREYRRMFHPKLPEICLHVSNNQRISEYELQRVFRISKDDLIYIFNALHYLGVINLDEERSEYSILEDGEKGLPFFEDKVIEFVDVATRHFESLLKKEQTENDRIQRELEENDPLFEQAVLLVVESQKASISIIQRHFRIGYNRAARIIERLEVEGIITSPGINGSRSIIVGKDYKYEEKPDDVPIVNNVIQFKR